MPKYTQKEVSVQLQYLEPLIEFNGDRDLFNPQNNRWRWVKGNTSQKTVRALVTHSSGAFHHNLTVKRLDTFISKNIASRKWSDPDPKKNAFTEQVVSKNALEGKVSLQSRQIRNLTKLLLTRYEPFMKEFDLPDPDQSTKALMEDIININIRMKRGD